MFTIYKATSPSNKVYIGFTSKTFARRKTQQKMRGIAHGPLSQTTKYKLSQQKLGLNNPQSKGGVTAHFGVFDSTRAASVALNVALDAIKRRCRNSSPKWSNWFYGRAA